MSPGHPRQEQEEERLALPLVGVVAAVALIVFTVAVLWAARILGQQTRQDQPEGPPPPPAKAGAPEIGIVDQTMFELEGRADALLAEQRRTLESYGWVDRDAGVIHIPIQEAMRQVGKELER
jgi:hypothetical protein